MLNTKYIVTKQGVYPNPDAMGNAWFVNSVLFVPTPDDESTALNTLDLHTTAVADEKFREILTCSGLPNEEDEIVMTSYAPGKLEYKTKTENDRVAVFSEIYYPHDWHLYCDGQEIPIGRTNYVLRSAVVPAGEHELQMTFVPHALSLDKWSMAATILGLLLSLACFSMMLWQRNTPSKE